MCLFKWVHAILDTLNNVCIIRMMIWLLCVWLFNFHCHAHGQDDATSDRHPERMLARLLPDQRQVHARITGKTSPGIQHRGMPVMVLDRDAHATIQSLGLEQCTSANAQSWVIHICNHMHTLYHAAFEYIEPDYVAHSLGGVNMNDPMLNDPHFPQSWHLPAIEAIQSWSISRGDEETRICIIDSGIDINHEDLIGNVDIQAYDAITRENTTVDIHGHGTMCAGIVAAKPDNGKGVVGLMWNAHIFSCRFLGEDGHGYLSDAMECMQWCVDHDARIMSNSWGTYSNSIALKDAMKFFSSEYGVIFVAAAGNDGLDNDGPTPMYPASYNLSSVISVAATDQLGELAKFSNFGRKSVHIAAPGVDIFSTWANNTYSKRSGTSFATPLVAATLGLMSSVRPDIPSMDSLVQILLDSSTQSPFLDDLVYDSRLLNVYEAVKKAQSYGQIGKENPVHNNFMFLHARVLNASNLPVKSAVIRMPDDHVASVLEIPENIIVRCPKSRYPRYDFKSHLRDTLLPKHIFVVEPSQDMSGMITLDTCIQPGGAWDSIIVMLDCSEDMHDCTCSGNNDSCGSKRQGSKVHIRLSERHRYIAIILPSDPLETGSYRLRITDASEI